MIGGVVAAALLLLLGGCRVDSTVTIDVAPDGSGNVAVEAIFDQAAAQALGGPDGLGDQVFVADMAAAGWAITRPELLDDGSTVVRASKDVPSRDQFQPVLDEIAGPGVFRNVAIVDEDQFAEHRQRVEVTVDLADGWGLFADDDITAALDGQPFGVPIEQLTDGRSIDEIIGVEVQLRQTGAEGGGGTGGTARFDGPPLELATGFVEEQATAVLLRWISYALASLFVLSIVLAATGLWLQRRADRLRPIGTPAKLSTRIPGAPAGTGDARTRASGATSTAKRSGRGADRRDGPVRLVVVEPLSVLYQQGEAPENYLLPFVRHNGGEARADAILQAREDLIRGRIDTAAFWSVTGVAGEPGETDRVFLEMRWLRKGAPAFLKALEHRRIPVAAISNDARSWSEASRARDRLTGVWPWLVSGDVGAAKPDPGMFERLRRETGVAYAHCLYLDTDLEALDAAQALGMRTALYNADDLDVPAIVNHPVVKDLTQLIKRAT